MSDSPRAPRAKRSLALGRSPADLQALAPSEQPLPDASGLVSASRTGTGACGTTAVCNITMVRSLLQLMHFSTSGANDVLRRRFQNAVQHAPIPEPMTEDAGGRPAYQCACARSAVYEVKMVTIGRDGRKTPDPLCTGFLCSRQSKGIPFDMALDAHHTLSLYDVLQLELTPATVRLVDADAYLTDLLNARRLEARQEGKEVRALPKVQYIYARYIHYIVCHTIYYV